VIITKSELEAKHRESSMRLLERESIGHPRQDRSSIHGKAPGFAAGNVE